MSLARAGGRQLFEGMGEGWGGEGLVRGGEEEGGYGGW